MDTRYEIYVLSDASRLAPDRFPHEYRRENLNGWRGYTKDEARQEAKQRKALDERPRLLLTLDLRRSSLYRAKT